MEIPLIQNRRLKASELPELLNGNFLHSSKSSSPSYHYLSGIRFLMKILRFLSICLHSYTDPKSFLLACLVRPGHKLYQYQPFHLYHRHQIQFYGASLCLLLYTNKHYDRHGARHIEITKYTLFSKSIYINYLEIICLLK